MKEDNVIAKDVMIEMIEDMIPYGKFLMSDIVISMRDLNKLIRRIE